MKTKIERLFTTKNIYYFFELCLLISIIPMIWIGLYNHPSADDYSIGMQCRLAWVDTHNIFLTIWAGVVRAYDDWLIWMGYFTSNFLMAVPPNVFGEKAYVLSTPILLAFLITSTKYLFKSILVVGLKCDKYLTGIISNLVLIVMIQRMEGRVEAFYWYCGASNYIITHSMCLFFMGLLIRFYNNEKTLKESWPSIAGACILGFFCGGGNQPSALNLTIVIVLLWIALFMNHMVKSKKAIKLLWPSVMAVIGFAFNVLAPGNSQRAAISEGMNPIKAVFISLSYYFEYCVGKWFTWPVLFLVIVLIPIFWKMFKGTKTKFRYPLIIVLLGYGLTSAMMTPSLFAVGSIEAARLKAMTFIMFLLTIVFSEGYVIGWLRVKFEGVADSLPQEDESGFSWNEIMVIGCSVLMFGFASIITIIPEPHYFTSSSAMTDILNGSARQYSKELDERVELFESGQKDVTISKLTVHPELLFYSDIDGDYNAWVRKALCKYYGLDSITVVESK